jgi:enhancing lycopene biosynthesis protein 2
MAEKRKIAVVLAGCGNKDGAEIHESVMTLWAIHRHGADYQCFAPDIPQYHVLNFITNEEMDEKRNVLVEAARIARGDIRDLAEFDPAEFDALIIPGGLGVVKNLSTFAFDGPDCRVNEELKRSILAMAEQQKPIGALCIAPALIAKVLGDVEVTVGSCGGTGKAMEKMGATVRETSHGQITVDRQHKIVSTPCYMLDARVDQIGEGADKLVEAILAMI